MAKLTKPQASLTKKEPEVEDMVARYNAGWQRTAEGYIEMGLVIEEAHQAFGTTKLKEFYIAIGLEVGDPTSTKLRRIGQAHTRFKPVISRLPNSWTTLYELAKLEASRFDQLVSDNKIHPKATLAEILNKSRVVTKRSRTLRIHIDKVEKSRVVDFASRLKELLSEFGVQVQKPEMAVLEELLPLQQPRKD